MTIKELNFARKAPIWKQRIIECRSSGLGVKPWCKANNLDHTTYYRWEKKILSSLSMEKNQLVEQTFSLPSETLPASRPRQAEIVKVELAPDPEAEEPAIVCITVNGYSLSLPTDISSSFLAKLLEATKNVG